MPRNSGRGWDNWITSRRSIVLPLPWGWFPLPSSAQWWGWSLAWGCKGLGDICWNVSSWVMRLSHILLLFQPSPCLLLGPQWPLCCPTACPAMTWVCRCFLLPQLLSVPSAGQQTLLEVSQQWDWLRSGTIWLLRRPLALAMARSTQIFCFLKCGVQRALNSKVINLFQSLDALTSG